MALKQEYVVISYQIIMFSILTLRKPTRETTEYSVVAERPYESLGSVAPQTSTSFYMGLVSRDTTSGNDKHTIANRNRPRR